MSRGECIVSVHSPNPLQPYITIDRADPHILVSDEILNILYDNEVNESRKQWAWLDAAPRSTDSHDCPAFPVNPHYLQHCFWGYLLHLNGDTTVIYRIKDYVPEYNAWEASWPD